MSKCVITINVNGQDLKMNLEDSSPSVLLDDSFIQALRDNPEVLQTMLDGIREESIHTGLNNVTVNQLKREGIQANCTLSYLRESPEFSDIYFPEGNANILLVNKLTLGGKSIQGRTINSNGEEVFIVKGNRKDVQKLANFLKIRNTIRDYGLSLSKDSKYYPELNEIYKNIKNKREDIQSIEDMLVDYISDKKAYSGIFLQNEGSTKSAIQILETFIRNLRDYDVPNSFEDPFVNDFNFRKFYKGDGEIFISNKDLYNILNQYNKPILEALGVTSQNAFNSLDNSDEHINQLREFLKSNNVSDNDIEQLIGDSKNTYDAILRIALSAEPDFNFKYEYNTKKGITLKQQFVPISEKYGIAFDTIQAMNTTDYRGYTIYEQGLPDGNKRYYISRGTMVEGSLSNAFSSQNEAKAIIDSSLNKQHLRKNSLVEFKFRDHYVDSDGNSHWDNSLSSEFIKSQTNFLPGQIIESINIPIDKNTNINGNEQYLLTKGAYTLQSFNKLIQTWPIDDTTKSQIISEIDTPEKAVTYIYKVNELAGINDRSDSKQLLDIANTIANATSNYYYIENRKYIGPNGWEYKVIPTEKDQIQQYKKQQSAPISLWMQAISTSLQNQFGVPIHLVTAEEVSNDLKGIADPNIDKAFIYNGEVYVNTTIASTNDLLHEHVHLILGTLKSNPELRSNYEKLLNLVLNTDEGAFTFNKLQDRYQGLSQMDLAEEVFAKLFSNYVRRQTTMQTDQVFNASEDQLKQITKSVFNTNISDIKDFYGKTLTSIFGKFNKEVAKMLQSSDLDFGSTKDSRKISRWVSEQVSKGEIIEKC